MQQPTREFDVVMQGTVFLDIVLTGLTALPSAGTEIPAEGMGSCPGGIANLAIAASRLGLRTSLATSFGDDLYGDFLARTLRGEGIDLSMSRQISNWHSPVTVSLAMHRDRAMITHSHPSPVPDDELIVATPSTAAGVLHLGGTRVPDWISDARGTGTLVFGDVGWDPTEQWSTEVIEQLAQLHAFLPNSAEAMAYTRTDDPRAALMLLADAVPVVVITCGGQGAIGVDSTTGEEEWVPSLPVNAVDATGAGDVFAAAFVSARSETGRCAPGWRSRTCARRCPSSRSVARWPRRGGVTSATGWSRSRHRPPPAPGRRRCWCTATSSWTTRCRRVRASRCAGLPQRSPGCPTPETRARAGRPIRRAAPGPRPAESL